MRKTIRTIEINISLFLPFCRMEEIFSFENERRKCGRENEIKTIKAKTGGEPSGPILSVADRAKATIVGRTK
ncbi:MAG: hypothetical protein H7177_06830 [Rhizobacter sp.]|nr:hypothetical protein [Bacteriovorax sp.]